MGAPPTLEQRLAVRQRPPGPALMRNRWEELLFLHWEWGEQELQGRLPPGLSVDTHEGKAYIGIVPFLMRAVSYASPLLRRPGFDFHELNVRTYVYDEQGRPGVWFFSLECDFLPAVLSARALFGLNYRWRNMLARRDEQGFLNYEASPLSVSDFTSENAAYRYRPHAEARQAEPGSLEFFLVERYRLFSQRAGLLYSGLVHHAPYEIGTAELAAYSALPIAWNGLAPPTRPPDHVLSARPVDVEIFGLQAN